MVVARLRAAGCVFAEEEAAVLASTAASPAELDALVARRAAGEPLEQVVGWAEFAGLRVLVVRVVAESTEDDLTAAEKNALIRRLDNYVTDLEDLWPILNSEPMFAGPARGHPERAVARQ